MDKDFEFKAIIFMIGLLIATSIFYTGNKLSLESKIETCQKIHYEEYRSSATKYQCLATVSGFR